MQKIQSFIWDMIKAIFGLFILTFIYVIFFYEVDATNEEPIKEENILTMEQAIKVLDKKNISNSIKPIKNKVEANTLNGGYPACLTKKDLGDYSLAGMKSDTKMMLYLINNNKCMITKEGTRFDLIDSSLFSGSAKVRIWINDKPMELFTNIENINI